MKGEMTEVAIIVAPAGRCAISGAASRSYSAPGPGYSASTPATTPTATSALISRSRNSIRCATNGCSVPASSSSGSVLGLGSVMGEAIVACVAMTK